MSSRPFAGSDALASAAEMTNAPATYDSTGAFNQKGIQS